MPSDLSIAIKTHQSSFGMELSDETIIRLDRYHQLLLEHNPILHLIGPMDAEEFALRHVLESLMLLKHLPEKTRFADIGSGGGLPAIPCLIARDGLSAMLIESKEKKTKFLELVLEELGLTKRAQVVTRQFQEVEPRSCEFVTCRALDKFTEKLDRLLKWAMRRQLFLFGGPNLGEALEKQKVSFEKTLLPLSNQRFLFILDSKRPT